MCPQRLGRSFRSLEQVLPDMRARTSALSPVPNSVSGKTPENIYQVPLLSPFVSVMLATVLTKSLKIRTKSSFLISVFKTMKLSPHVSPRTYLFLSSPLANSSQPHTLAWSRLRPSSEVVWALLREYSPFGFSPEVILHFNQVCLNATSSKIPFVTMVGLFCSTGDRNQDSIHIIQMPYH